jgi:hypothetical protein
MVMTEPDKATRSAWLLPLVGAIGVVGGAAITGIFNYVSHKGDIDAKIIEIGVGVLRAEPTTETMPLRDWGIDVIEKRAGFKFTPEQKAALKKKSLPFSGPAAAALTAHEANIIGQAISSAIRTQQ